MQAHVRWLLVAIGVVTAGGAIVTVATQGEAAPAEFATLEPGDSAPPFTLKGSDGLTYRLADFRGRRAVVLAWFAKAFTGG